MSSVDIAVACALLAALMIYFIFSVKPEASDNAPHRTQLDQLMERRDAIYENLRDLRFEFRAGKFSGDACTSRASPFIRIPKPFSVIFKSS